MFRHQLVTLKPVLTSETAHAARLSTWLQARLPVRIWTGPRYGRLELMRRASCWQAAGENSATPISHGTNDSAYMRRLRAASLGCGIGDPNPD
jgi:hypothetical protein